MLARTFASKNVESNKAELYSINVKQVINRSNLKLPLCGKIFFTLVKEIKSGNYYLYSLQDRIEIRQSNCLIHLNKAQPFLLLQIFSLEKNITLLNQ